DFIEYWQANPTQNYGMEMSISDLNQAGGAHRQYYDVNFGLASGPLLKLSFTVKPQLKIDFVDSLDHGSITLNSPSGSLPYRYMISHNPIGSLTDVWNTLNDTITNDSITFFRGDINSQNYTFSNLNSGKYYIAVFDNDGAKLVDTSTYLSPDISLVNSTGVTVNGDQISRSNSSQGDGTASFSKLLRNNHSGGIAFEVESLGGFIIGFNNDTDALATATSHFEFGVNIQPNGSYAVIDTGVVTSNTGTIHAGDDIYLVKEGNDFVFYVEDTVAYRHTLHSQLTDDFTVDFVLKDQNIELKRHTLLGQLRFPKPYPSYPKLGCGTTTTDISIKIPVGITLNSCVLTNNQTSAIITPSSSCVYEDVPIGTYTMLVSYSYGSSTFTYPYQLAVGYLVDWENLVDCQIILGTNNTLIPGPGTIAPDWASADSEAKTFNAESGWVQFETDVFGSGASWLGSDPSNFQYLAFEESDGNQAFGVSTNNIFSSGVAAFGDDAITTESFFTSPNGVFRVDLNYNETSDEIEVELYKNGATSLLSTTSLSDNGPFELHTMQYGKPQLINTISSFCPVPQIVQYIEPKRDSEGGYYEVPDDDILRFEFHEEYTTGSDLNYVVRNYQGQEQSLSSIPESFGDNRLSLDVSSLISGYYVMEILNDKNENWFIRFKVL
ncbi:MAG: hypothetical protein MI810_01925, partial [Flavobacteriales bacterium]|nr:hypothetical protein [Flavobacteriales bacterium]